MKKYEKKKNLQSFVVFYFAHKNNQIRRNLVKLC